MLVRTLDPSNEQCAGLGAWQKNTTRKQKTRPMKNNECRQDIATRTPITRVELMTISIVTIRSIWHNSAADFLAFWKISAANLRILWHHLPTELRNVYCVVKHIWSSNKQRKFSIIFEIWYLVKRPVSNMIVLPPTKFCINRTKNRWVIAKNDFQYGGRPPFWISKILIPCHVTALRKTICVCVPNFIENGWFAAEI